MRSAVQLDGPANAGEVPMMVFIVVLLPEAFPPSRQTISPRLHLEVDVEERLDRAVEGRDARERAAWAQAPGRRGRRRAVPRPR